MHENLSIFIPIALLAIVILWFIQRLRALMQAPENNPGAFLKHGRQDSTHTLVICAGDSLTHGIISANYVDLLQQRFESDGYEFVNAGINGNLAYNVLQRVDDIIACRPTVVTLLIGTNDVNATISPEWEASYRRDQHIPQTPTLAWYRVNVAQILERLKTAATPHIAVLSIPMLGEDLESAINTRVANYNTVLRELATEKQVTYLPLHERLLVALPPKHTPRPYAGKVAIAVVGVLKKLVLRQPWTAVSKENGLYFLTDQIHLNERGAEIIATLIGEFLRTSRTGTE